MLNTKIDKISKKLTRVISYYGIAKNNLEIYEFGFKEILWNLIHIINIFIIGSIMGETINLLLIFTFYCPIRIYTGGYHSSTREGCYIGTIVLSILLTSIKKLKKTLTIKKVNAKI